MKRPSLSTTRRPVVLLVQASRDDSLEMYAEFLRYHGLAVIPVADARDGLPLTGSLAQWQGHGDGDIHVRKEALYGPTSDGNRRLSIAASSAIPQAPESEERHWPLAG